MWETRSCHSDLIVCQNLLLVLFMAEELYSCFSECHGFQSYGVTTHLRVLVGCLKRTDMLVGKDLTKFRRKRTSFRRVFMTQF